MAVFREYSYLVASSTVSARYAWCGSSSDAAVQPSLDRRSDSRRPSAARDAGTGESDSRRALVALSGDVFEHGAAVDSAGAPAARPAAPEVLYHPERTATDGAARL